MSGLGTGARIKKRNGKKIVKGLLKFIFLYAVVLMLIGWWWSLPPRSELVLNLPENPVVGYRTTAAVYGVGETLLHKTAPFKGGYISNDLNPLTPGLYIDNIKNWEFGALLQLRDSAQALRNQFSRTQSQSEENKYLGEAEPAFSFSNNSWLLPMTESKYKEGLGYLESYLQQLQDNSNYADFNPRADNLVRYLETVSTRLGGLSQALSSVSNERAEHVSWFKQRTLVDDNFYQAQGYCWALLQVLNGIEADFSETLAKKEATASLQQIIDSLESTQAMVWSPVILNGHGFGLFANHSLVIANYVSRANAGIIDLQNLLKNG